MSEIELDVKNLVQHGPYKMMSAAPLRKFANPAPLAFFSFAMTNLIASLINIQSRGVTEANIVLGMAITCGGAAQILAGMWQFANGDTFDATGFTAYGAFWIAYALIYIPGTGILDAYANSPAEFDNAMAFFLTAWFIFTFCIFIASLRTSIVLIAIFFCLDIKYMFLMIGAYTGSNECNKIAGSIGLLTSALAFYNAMSGLLTRESSYFLLPTGEFPKSRYATV